MTRSALSVLGSIAMAAALSLLGVAGPRAALADPPDTITPFASSGLTRQIQGREHAIDLSLAGRRLGDARAFFGLDALSTAQQKYLTSGLQWENEAGPTPALQLSALHTEASNSDFGSQTLMRAESRLDLGQRWYMPDLTTQIAQVSQRRAASTRLGGRSAHIGLGHAVGRGNLNIGYFATDAAFDALGSALAAGDRGFELSAAQALGARWQLTNSLRLHDTTAEAATLGGVVQQWTLQQRSALTDIGRPWRLSAQVGSASAAGEQRHTPLSLELATRTASWRDWHVDSVVGWFDRGMSTPDALPVDGGLWRVQASHALDIAGLRTRLSPSFALGGSPYDGAKLGSRTGLGLAFPGLGQGLQLKVDYLSAGWGPSTRNDDVQMMLNYSHGVGGLMPDLSSLVEHLRAPWSHRY